jgi:putative transposase
MNAEPRYRIMSGGVQPEIPPGATAHSMEVMPDHVHRYVEAGATLSVAEIINRIKRRSSRVLRHEFTSLRSRLPTLWTRSSKLRRASER